MSKPKVLLYAPREEPKPIIDALRDAGLDVVEGDRRWQTPGGQHREPFLAAARDAVALMGTSSRFTPLARPLREACQRRRVVAKYTAGVDDIDRTRRATLGSWSVMRRRRRIASASPRRRSP